MAKRIRYDAATKDHAIKLALQLGKAEAARRTGINAGTIGCWLSRAGLATVAGENIRAAVEVRQATLEERRLRLGQRLLALAENSVEAAEKLIAEANLRDLVGAYDYAIKNSNLLTGAATTRSETVDATASHALVDELEQRMNQPAT